MDGRRGDRMLLVNIRALRVLGGEASVRAGARGKPSFHRIGNACVRSARSQQVLTHMSLNHHFAHLSENDSASCDPGIQPHGAMLVCTRYGDQVLSASRNISEITGYSGKLIPGVTVADILGPKAAHDLRNAAARINRPGVAGIVLDMHVPGAVCRFNATTHHHEDKTFIEIEPCDEAGQDAGAVLDLTRQLVQRIGEEQDVDALARSGVRLIRAMLGYDRVLIYQFLHNGAGRVIAETKGARVTPLQGQHFPAADIPVSVRRLYSINPIRIIPDIDATPVSLFPLAEEERDRVDLSFAHLRGVSPIHRDYLRNIGIAASLSISIVAEGRLWGLIVCHHAVPKFTPLPSHLGAEMFGQCFSMQIAAAEKRAAGHAAEHARARFDSIVDSFVADGSPANQLGGALPALAGLLDCDGVGLWMDNAWYVHGDTLDRDMARQLARTARQHAPRGIWHTQELRAYLPIDGIAVAGGLAVPLSLTFDDYLFFFRNEEAHTIEWIGARPPPAVSINRLTPRASFEAWRQEVEGRSTPWTDVDLSIASAICTGLRDFILRQNELSAEERRRNEQRRRILNDELNHRVKNILSLVKSIALHTGSTAASVSDYAAALEGRLLALAKAHDQSLGNDGGDIVSLIDTAVSFHRHGSAPDRVRISGPAVRLDDRAFSVLALVIHEMVTNAAKYGALSVAGGRLEIVWEVTEEGGFALRWTEINGPPAKPPERAGFGTRLIRSSIEYDLRGTVEMNYAPAGLSARFVIPASYIDTDRPLVTETQPATETWQKPAISPSLAGLAILVVEDQGLIAMDAEEILRKLGAEDVRLAATSEEAQKLLDGFDPHAVVLDFDLGDSTSEGLAETLMACGVPFVFMTGYSEGAAIPDRFRHVPVVRKPIDPASIATQIGIAREVGAGSELPS